MYGNFRFLTLLALGFFAQSAPAANHPTMAEVLAASSASDWRPLDPDHTLYVELPSGRVVIELAPAFAPLIESRRNRPEEFFKVQAGHIDLCNVPIVARERKSPAPQSP